MEMEIPSLEEDRLPGTYSTSMSVSWRVNLQQKPASAEKMRWRLRALSVYLRRSDLSTSSW